MSSYIKDARWSLAEYIANKLGEDFFSNSINYEIRQKYLDAAQDVLEKTPPLVVEFIAKKVYQ